jgi:hypothetical protein
MNVVLGLKLDSYCEVTGMDQSVKLSIVVVRWLTLLLRVP